MTVPSERVKALHRVVPMVRATREPEDSNAGDAVRRDRRSDVIRVAVELFAERGYKETTATDIAERAGISRRAFFYYFNSKDDILFSVKQGNLDMLASLVSEQPEQYSDLEAIAAAWKAFGYSNVDARESGESRSMVLQLRRAAENSALLRGKESELHLAYEAALARGLAERRGLAKPDRSAKVAAAMGQSLMHLVADEWVSDPATDRNQLITEYFAAAMDSTDKRTPHVRRQGRS